MTFIVCETYTGLLQMETHTYLPAVTCTQLMHRCKPAAFDSFKWSHVLLTEANQRILEPAKQVMLLSKYMQWLLPAAHVTHARADGGWTAGRVEDYLMLCYLNFHGTFCPIYLGSCLVVVVGGGNLASWTFLAKWDYLRARCPGSMWRILSSLFLLFPVG